MSVYTLCLHEHFLKSPRIIGRTRMSIFTHVKIGMLPVIVYPGEDGYWVAQCPSLPPCISQGETKDIAIANIKEAIELYIEFLQEEGRIIPWAAKFVKILYDGGNVV